ncbi:MAG: hypothetical protein J6S43_06160 [Lentisphaeria bacterium]|nr:hypothetical protein [Lentisphaeria bacterium]
MKKNCYDPSAPEIDMQFRPVPFWSWNDRLEKSELLRQIHELYQAGNGGFFMHARGGLKTEYMGQQWLDAISLCTREAVKLGMKPWLYDENGWPSGFGNGLVNGLGTEYQAKYAKLLPVTGISDRKQILAWYDENGRRLPDDNNAAYALQIFVNPFYVDNLNPAVVREFIKQIYQRYWDELPPDVRENLTGIFTDEPQLSCDGIPWSMVLTEKYREDCGRELLDDFPELSLETGNWRQTRIRFWKSVTTLFRDSYINQIGQWCREHNWQLTGHHLMEESFDSQLNINGSVMPQYEGFTSPGIDHLYRVSTFLTPEIQVVSASAMNGQRQVLAETFGCSGWNFNLRGMKWLAQQHLVLGINLLCQHLAAYSLHGLRKRDYPASIFYQHPMWKYVRQLNDSFSRVGRMLATGDIECEVLVIHGESSAWMRSHGHFQDHFSGNIFQNFCQLSQMLSAAGIPFHYGDEIMLAEKGTVSGGKLRSGAMSYSCAVIPAVDNLLSSTVQLLQKFSAQGGRIIRLAMPENGDFYIDGRLPEESELQFLNQIPVCPSPEEAVAFLRQFPALEIRNIGGQPGRVRGTWRNFPEKSERWYYLADFAFLPENRIPDEDFLTEIHSNVPEVESACALEITLPFPADFAEIIDQESGAVSGHADLICRPDGKCTFLKTIPAAGSLLLRTGYHSGSNRQIDLTANWQVHTDDNVMTLEKVAYRLEDSSCRPEETDTLSLFNRLLALGKDTPLQLCYTFEVSPEFDPEKADLKIAVEPDDSAAYFLNGTEIKPEFLPGYFLDRSIRILQLPVTAIRAGTNFFEVKSIFSQSPEIRAAVIRAKEFGSEANKLSFDSEVEAVYLLGKFGCFCRGEYRKEKAGSFFLAPSFIIGNMPETVDSGRSVLQGFPFFTGTLVLEKEIELSGTDAAGFRKLCWSQFKADTVQVTVNGKSSGWIFAPPYEFDLTNLLKEGKNHIRVALETSCRNTLGPFHTPETEPICTSPGSFLTEQDFLGKYHPGNVAEYGVLEPSPEKIVIC